MGIALIAAIVIGAAANRVLAQGPALPPGEYDLEVGQYVFNVPELVAPTDTPVPPTNTPVPPSPTPDDQSAWHGPQNHEHGDAPPQWVLDSPIQPYFDKGEAHSGFKGFHFIDYDCCDSSIGKGVEAYTLIHILSFPNARLTQFHSYQVWLLDEAGNVSYWQGKTDAGDPNTRRFTRAEGDPGGKSDRIICVGGASRETPYEQWYTDAGYLAGPNFGWNIYEPNYFCGLPESTDQATWTLGPGGHMGLERDPAEVIWHRVWMEDANIFDHIYCTSSVVAGMVDCSEPGALENYVYSTFPAGRGNLKREMIRQSRIYSCPDCEVPN